MSLEEAFEKAKEKRIQPNSLILLTFNNPKYFKYMIEDVKKALALKNAGKEVNDYIRYSLEDRTVINRETGEYGVLDNFKEEDWNHCMEVVFKPFDHIAEDWFDNNSIDEIFEPEELKALCKLNLEYFSNSIYDNVLVNEYLLAFKMDSWSTWTDYGYEYDSDYIFLGIVDDISKIPYTPLEIK